MDSMSERSSPAAEDAASRRRSGRVVSKPQKFAPNATTQKRKRASNLDGGDDRNASDEDIEDESMSDDDSDDAPGDEELKAQRRRKRSAANSKKGQARPAKKSKAGQSVKNVALAHRPAKKATGKAAKMTTKSAPPIIDEEATGLYADVFDEDADLEEVAESWIKSFKKHESSAVADLFNMILRCSGCNITIDQYVVEDPDHFTDKLTEIQEAYQEQSVTEYPLIAKGKAAASFRQILTEYLNEYIHAIAKSKILYQEPTLMEIITSWIGPMSSAGNRPFRHTGTVVALTIMTSLCDVAAGIVKNAAQIQRQAAGEKRKKGANKSRVSELDKQVASITKSQDIINAFLQSWFDTVFVHRYRDVDFHIRIECARALGGWMFKYPELYLESSFLRYLGWIMSDTVAQTRHEVVRALVKLYKDESKLSGLRSFSERFRPRMVEMAARDHDSGVRVASIELLDVLRQAGFLEPDDTDQIGRLIFDSDARVRKAVVKLFAANVEDLYDAKVEELGGQATLDELFEGEEDDENNFERPRQSWLRFKSLAELLSHYDAQDEIEPGDAQASAMPEGYLMVAAGMESRFSLAAEVLYDHIKDLRDWETLSGYLLFDHSSRSKQNGTTDTNASFKAECKLAEKEEILLLEVLNSAVKLGLTSTVKAAAEMKVKKPAKKAKEEAEEAQETATRNLAQLIPRLLTKFGTIPDATFAVLRLEHVLNLEIFEELRQDLTAYARLLDDIKKQFLTHNESRIVEEASRALLHARSFEDLEEVTEEKMQSLWDTTINAFTKLTKGTNVGAKGKISGQALTALSGTVLRMRKLAEISDPIDYLDRELPATKQTSARSVIATLIDMIDRGVSGSSGDAEADAAEDSLLLNTSSLCFQYFMWQVSILNQQLTRGGKISTSDADHLRDLRQQFVDSLTNVLGARNGADELRLSLAGTLIDVHAAYVGLLHAKPTKINPKDKDTANDNKNHLELVQEVPRSTQKLLTSILNAAEKTFAKRSKKTLEEPEEDDDPEDEADEPENDEAEDEDGEESEQRMAYTLLAERSLCNLAGRLVLGILAGILDGKANGQKVKKEGRDVGAVENRLRRNYKKLGPNFKAVIDEFDGHRKGPAKRKPAAAAAAAAKTGNAAGPTAEANKNAVASTTPKAGKAAPKSDALVIESDVESELSEDDEEDEETRAVAEEAQRKDLADQDEAMEDVEDGADDRDDADSIVGD